jgi:hypothetical protein
MEKDGSRRDGRPGLVLSGNQLRKPAPALRLGRHASELRVFADRAAGAADGGAALIHDVSAACGVRATAIVDGFQGVACALAVGIAGLLAVSLVSEGTERQDQGEGEARQKGNSHESVFSDSVVGITIEITEVRHSRMIGGKLLNHNS